MPPGKRQQNNAMLYYLITFVGLFLVATVVAIICYVKIEDYRTIARESKSKLEKLASPLEQRKGLGKIVGSIPRGKSALGTLSGYLDQMVSLITGEVPENTSAEVKADATNRKAKEALELLARAYFETESVSPPKAVTNEFVELLVKGQFSVVTGNFDETMKNALPADKLEETWNAVIGQAGSFKRQIGSRTQKQDSYDVVLVTCEFENSPLDVKIVYNSEKLVAGLFFEPTAPEVLKSYQSTPEIKIKDLDPNAGLLRTIEVLNAKLDNITNAEIALKEQFERLQSRFGDAMKAGFEKEETLLAEKEKYQQQVNGIMKDYNELKVLMEQTTAQQVQMLSTQLIQERDNSKKLKQDMLKTDAELKLTRQRMELVLKRLWAVVPPPDSDVAAYKADGRIMSIDNNAKIVYLNIGSDDRVYQGLTFGVYDKSMPIPKDGRAKSEIEIFNVDKNISSARIIRSEKKKPIVLGDIVANLIWDSSKTNVFVVAGDFDVDGDGDIDYDAEKIKALIKKWGGRVVDTVSTDTDFVVLGTAPQIRRRPDFEEMEVDPMAMEKYEASIRKLAYYKQVLKQARDMWIPIFNTERFLYFIGYKTQSARPGAF